MPFHLSSLILYSFLIGIGTQMTGLKLDTAQPIKSCNASEQRDGNLEQEKLLRIFITDEDLILPIIS